MMDCSVSTLQMGYCQKILLSYKNPELRSVQVNFALEIKQGSAAVAILCSRVITL